MNTQSILRLRTESVALSSVGFTFRGRPTKDSSPREEFVFDRFVEMRNETVARHLLSRQVIDILLEYSIHQELLLSHQRSTSHFLQSMGIKYADNSSRFKIIRFSEIKYLRDACLDFKINKFNAIKHHFDPALETYGDKKFLTVITELLYCVETRDLAQLKNIINAADEVTKTHLYTNVFTRHAKVCVLKMRAIAERIFSTIEKRGERSANADIRSDLIFILKSYETFAKNKMLLEKLCNSAKSIFLLYGGRNTPHSIFDFNDWMDRFQVEPYRVIDKSLTTDLFGLLHREESEICFFQTSYSSEKTEKLVPNVFIKEITDNCIANLNRNSLIDLSSIEVIQVLSTGRAGTSFLRQLIAEFSTKFYSAHEIYNIPTLEARSVLQVIINQISIGKGDLVYELSVKSQALKDYLIFHIALFSAEIISHHQQKKPLAILNHWWTPFSLVFAQIFPNIKFIQLYREQDELLFALINKHQIISNPMPKRVIGKSIDDMQQIDLEDWSHYHIANLDSISNILSSDNHNIDIMTFAPPDQESAERAIEYFHLQCTSEQILNEPKDNEK